VVLIPRTSGETDPLRDATLSGLDSPPTWTQRSPTRQPWAARRRPLGALGVDLGTGPPAGSCALSLLVMEMRLAFLNAPDAPAHRPRNVGAPRDARPPSRRLGSLSMSRSARRGARLSSVRRAQHKDSEEREHQGRKQRNPFLHLPPTFVYSGLRALRGKSPRRSPRRAGPRPTPLNITASSRPGLTFARESRIFLSVATDAQGREGDRQGR
jgi:hypothetical protein